MFSRSSKFLIFILFSVSIVSAQKKSFFPYNPSYGVSVEYSYAFDNVKRHIVVRYEFNNTTSEKKVWRISFTVPNYYRGVDYERDFSVEARSKAVFEEYYDIGSTNSYQFNLNITGYGFVSNPQPIVSKDYYGNREDKKYLGFSEGLEQYFNPYQKEQIDYSVKTKTFEDVFFVKFNPALLPTKYQGFLDYNYLIFDSSEIYNLTVEQKTALKKWVMQGGELFIFNAQNNQFFCDGVESEVQKKKSIYLRFCNQHLGRVNFLEESPDYSLENYIETSASTDINKIIETIGEKLPKLDINIMLVLIIVGIYGVVVGPINILFLARKKRLMLYVTTPIISAAASILLAISIIIGDGFGLYGERLSIVFLNSKNFYYHIKQYQGYKSGILFNANFLLNGDDRFTVLDQEYRKNPYNLKQVSFNVINNEVSGDLFLSRNVGIQSLTGERSTRYKITDTGSEIISDLPVKIDELFVVNNLESGYSYKLYRDILPGVPVKISSDITANSELDNERFKFQKLIEAAYDINLNREGRSFYIAKIKSPSSEFFIPTLSDAKWSDSLVIIGKFDGSSN